MARWRNTAATPRKIFARLMRTAAGSIKVRLKANWGLKSRQAAWARDIQTAGIAWGERRNGNDKRIYCLFSDGELQEGNLWEAAMFAGHQGLDNMVWIVDNNDLQATTRTQDVMTVEPVHDKFAAFGCHARQVDGHSIPDILDAFAEARTVKANLM